MVCRWLKAVKKDKPIKTLKTDDKDIVERLQKQLQDAIAAKEAAATTEQKLQAAAAVEAAKALQRKVISQCFDSRKLILLCYAGPKPKVS